MNQQLSLEIESGEFQSGYIEHPPWHDQGFKLEGQTTSLEVIQAASLDWNVIKQPLFINTPFGLKQVPDKFVIMRQDFLEAGINRYFGIVSGSYTILQNSEAFAFFDDIVSEGQAVYESAGAVGDGERIWILVKLPEIIQILGDDICFKYLLFSNSHDGRSSVQVKFTPLRFFCSNMLTLALSQGPTIRIKHTSNLQERMVQADKLLGLVQDYYQEIEENFKAMTNVNMDDGKLDRYYRLIYPDPADLTNEKALARQKSNRVIAAHFYKNGSGNKNPRVAGTLWAAYNGITEYVDHWDSGLSGKSRFTSISFGSGYQIKARAYRYAVEILTT